MLNQETFRIWCLQGESKSLCRGLRSLPRAWMWTTFKTYPNFKILWLAEWKSNFIIFDSEAEEAFTLSQTIRMERPSSLELASETDSVTYQIDVHPGQLPSLSESHCSLLEGNYLGLGWHWVNQYNKRLKHGRLCVCACMWVVVGEEEALIVAIKSHYCLPVNFLPQTSLQNKGTLSLLKTWDRWCCDVGKFCLESS